MRRPAGLLALALVLAACAGSPSTAPVSTDAPSPTATTPPSAPTSSPPTPTSTAEAVAPVEPSETAPSFDLEVAPVAGTPVAERMTGTSWREGCPVGLEDLRHVTLTHHTPVGDTATGELVVHADVVDDVGRAFRRLFELGFPVERMELVDAYGADDQASMRANNTSAFNCRFVAGTQRWSNHAFGKAIDVNPLWNPYVRGGTVDPPEGAPWADRSVDQPGMLHPGSPEVAAFTDLGWDWGGAWASGQDYQHVSATGG